MAEVPDTLPTTDGRRRLERHRRRIQGEVVQALGGPDHVTPQQIIASRQLAQAGALREAVFARIAEGIQAPAPEAIAAFTSLAATEQRALKLLGMARRARPVETLDDLRRRIAAKASAAEGSTDAS